MSAPDQNKFKQTHVTILTLLSLEMIQTIISGTQSGKTPHQSVPVIPLLLSQHPAPQVKSGDTLPYQAKHQEFCS